jgi:FMN phosphatase YigB (HAD superfamily)
MRGEAAGKPWRAVLFDVDGTLYSQKPLRLRMAAELLLAGPLRGRLVTPDLKVLQRYRKLRETLRDGRPEGMSLAEAEYAVPARALGVGLERVREVVEEWIHRRPLRYLAGVRRKGLQAGLQRLREAGLRVGVFSDHRIGHKLEALGVHDLVDGAWDATDAEIDAFKPDPRGFEVCCERLGVPCDEAVYVGDRVEVDLEGARAAGMACLLIGGKARKAAPEVAVRDVPQLVERILQHTAPRA